MRPPGLRLEELPRIDILLLSHNHWDHLDITTLKKIYALYCPRIQSVPAQHFSGRGLFDWDATLWCGYVIKRPAGNIYFGGDTGYHPQTFKEIGERCAPVEVALVPIGAFKPQWFMPPIHCSPEEAVKIHQE